LGISLIEEPIAEGTPAAIARAFAAILRARPDAVSIGGSPEFYVHRRLVLDLIEKNHLPAIFQTPELVTQGGLMSYGNDIPDLYRRWADIVHRVLTGTKPGDIPIAQPTKFVFAINLRTAKALGLTIPQSLLAFADEVVE
jgi:putative ABC transport system substrate-binding protein